MKALLFACVLTGTAFSANSPANEARTLSRSYHRPNALPLSPLNPSTPEKIELGRMLFFDPRLSASGIVSCATCHNPSLSWSDGLPRAVGNKMKVLERRTPTILNIAYGGPFMWDGRFETLEEQALGPITSPDEMNLPPEELLARVQGIEGYRRAFTAAFSDGLTVPNIGRAIASFERTIVSADAPFDRWVSGDARALSPSAQRGFVLFNTRAQCSKCHGSWRFTDDSFHDIGVKSTDLGRGAVKDFADIEVMQSAFKTPSLRDVERRAPFFHDGSLQTLEAVVEFYDRGGDVRRASLSTDMRPLGLTVSEKEDLVAFMKSLSAPETTRVPVLPR